MSDIGAAGDFMAGHECDEYGNDLMGIDGTAEIGGGESYQVSGQMKVQN